MRKQDCTHSEHAQTLEKVRKQALSTEEVERVSRLFRMLGEPSRLKIVLSLLEGEMCVYHITEACGAMQSATSQQLRILKDNKILRSRREGHTVLYSIADDHVREMVEMGKLHLQCGKEEDCERGG